MNTKRPALFSDNLPRDAGASRMGTVIGGPFLGRVDVQVAGGEILRRVPLSGAATAGDVVRLTYEGGDYIAQGTRPGDGVTGGGVVLGAGGGAGNIPNPHDLLGSNHTLPTAAANSFFASPAGTAGLPAFRAIVPADLPGGFAGFASPSAQAGMTAIAGSSNFAMRADAAPAINAAITPTWTGLHTFGAGAKIDAGQSLFFGADVTLSRLGANVLGLGAGDSYTSTGYVSGLTGWAISGDGDAEFNNIQARGELRAFVFKINELSATAGTFGVFYSAATAWADFTTAAALSGSFTLRAKNSDAGAMLFGVGDICRVKAWNGAGLVDCWFTITARTNETDRTLYTATLNSGSTSATIREGSAIVDYGPSGTGFITLSADGTVGSTPNLTMGRHSGTPWSGFTPLLRAGNLSGYGPLGTTYGVAIGDPASAWSYWDGSSMRFRQGANDIIVFDGAGNLSYFAGLVTIGASGEIRQGTGTVGANFTGLRIFNSAGVGIIAGYNANAAQWQAGTDGKFYIGPYIRGDQDGLYVYGNYQPGYGSSGSLQVRYAGSIYMGSDTRAARIFGTLSSNGAGTDYSAKLDVWLPASGAGGSLRTWSIDAGTGLMNWDGNINAGGNLMASGAAYASNWFRSYGNTGWYSESYGGGIYMAGADSVRTYNGKPFRADGGFQRNGVWGGLYVPLGAYNGVTTTGGTALNGSGSIGTGNYTVTVTGFGVPPGARAVQLAVAWVFDTNNVNYYAAFTYNGVLFSVHRANNTVVQDSFVTIPVDDSNNIGLTIAGRYINQLWVGVIGYFY